MNREPDLPKPPATYRAMHAAMAPVLKLFGITCRTAYELASVRMDRGLSRSESLRLRVHLLMCGLCRRLPSQFAGLRQCVRHACERDEAQFELPDEHLPPESEKRIATCLRDPSVKS